MKQITWYVFDKPQCISMKSIFAQPRREVYWLSSQWVHIFIIISVSLWVLVIFIKKQNGDINLWHYHALQALSWGRHEFVWYFWLLLKLLLSHRRWILENSGSHLHVIEIEQHDMQLINLVKYYSFVEMKYMVNVYKHVCIFHTLFKLMWITDM